MKRNQVTLAVLLAALSFFAAPSANAISRSDIVAIKKAVADVPAAEMAATAAQLVSQATAADRQQVAVTAVREIASKRPAVLVAVVAAIAKVAPDVSVAVATEAAKLVGKQAAEIAKAAATGAPEQADKIAAAVAKVSPKAATTVAREVALVAPEQTTRIVEHVLASVPAAQTAISADATITRLSQRSAGTQGPTGNITTRPGTISGAPAPVVPPSSVGAPTAGSDPQRRYGSPSS